MAKSRPLLDRLLNTPGLEKIVPRLQPDVLHRLIQTCGLEDAAGFVALATPAQLAHVLDLDIWRRRTTGGDEEFDADRFGEWIGTLMQLGAAAAAEKLAGLDIELVVAGFAHHAFVFEQAAVSSYTTLDGEYVPGRGMNRGPVAEIGGYVLEARRTSAWEAIVDLLAYLQAERSGYFRRLMQRCVRLSSERREADGFHGLLDDDDQHVFDLACDRETRRERQGYVAPAQASAFLRGARNLQLDAGQPPPSAIARAHFRAIEWTLPTGTDRRRESGGIFAESASAAPSRSQTEAVAGFVEVLREAGVLAPQPRALLGMGDQLTSRLDLIQGHVAAHPASADELAFLANTMIAGCSIQGRPFTVSHASDAAVATCNLGLENWPPRWSDRDLVTAFQIGWTVLHRDVCMYSARHVIDVLAGIRCSDPDIHFRLRALRHGLTQHLRNEEPWRARDALDVILILDAGAWAALLALIDECPVIHAALGASRQRVRTISPTDFQFVSRNSQIAAVREFVASLPLLLTC